MCVCVGGGGGGPGGTSSGGGAKRMSELLLRPVGIRGHVHTWPLMVNTYNHITFSFR